MMVKMVVVLAALIKTMIRITPMRAAELVKSDSISP
jgi:hypothetical protein